MSPEFHRQMIDQRASDLRREAADYHRARQAQKARKDQKERPSGEHRNLFGKIIST